jgi:hypothetical protein
VKRRGLGRRVNWNRFCVESFPRLIAFKLDFDKAKPIDANSTGQVGVLLPQALYAFLNPLMMAEDLFNSGWESCATRTSGMLFAGGKRAMFDMLDITRHSPQVGSAGASRIL